MKLHECDILIIGAGPAGSSAATAASKAGVDVLMIERRTVIGQPVKCAEYIPAQLLGKVPVSRRCIAQQIHAMRTFFPDGKTTVLSGEGFTIHRHLFDQTLAENAQKQGARLLTGIKAVDLIDGIVRVDTADGRLDAILPKIIIGADGPHSIVGKWMGSINDHMIRALQVRANLVSPMEITEIYFNESFFGGYGWLFPKGNKANIGIGLVDGHQKKQSIQELLSQFVQRLKELGKIDMIEKGYTGGWAPSTPRSLIRKKNFMLVGDAAGHTHPITGAGTPQAVIDGHMAGKWAAMAIKENSIEVLANYETEWNDMFGEAYQRASIRRQLMETQWNNLNDVIKMFWPGFREYYGKA